MNGYWGSGDTAPRILDIGIRWMWVVSITPWLLYPQGKNPWYPLDRRLGGPQTRFGRRGEDKNSQLLAGLELPIIQPVAQRYATELSRLFLSIPSEICFHLKDFNTLTIQGGHKQEIPLYVLLSRSDGACIFRPPGISKMMSLYHMRTNFIGKRCQKSIQVNPDQHQHFICSLIWPAAICRHEWGRGRAFQKAAPT
jgi:hypothetical protein